MEMKIHIGIKDDQNCALDVIATEKDRSGIFIDADSLDTALTIIPIGRQLAMKAMFAYAGETINYSWP